MNFAVVVFGRIFDIMEVTQLGFVKSKRYPYVVRITITRSAIVNQKMFDLLNDIQYWADEVGLDYKIAGMSIYLPSMKEATAILLRWS